MDFSQIRVKLDKNLPFVQGLAPISKKHWKFWWKCCTKGWFEKLAQEEPASGICIQMLIWGSWRLQLSFSGGGVVCAVIFVSNPTTLLRLCCVVVGVVTRNFYMQMWFPHTEAPSRKKNCKNFENWQSYCNFWLLYKNSENFWKYFFWT